MTTIRPGRAPDGADHPLTILTVVRAPGLRSRLAQLLTEVPGLAVAAQASSVAEALVLLRQAPFDVVLLGVDLGPREGLRALAELRREAAASALVVLGRGGEPEVRERYRQAGADAFLVTALELDRLGEALLGLGRPSEVGARGGAR